MKHYKSLRFKPLILIPFLLLTFIGICFWIQHRQILINRKLIASLVKQDSELALQLVNQGASPDTPCDSPISPSFSDYWGYMLHRKWPHDNDSPTAWQLACGARWMNGFQEVHFQPDAPRLIEAMLRHGSNINVVDKSKWTILMRACCCDHDKTDHPLTVKVLLQHGANVNAQTDHTRNVLLLAIAYGASPKTIRLLLEYGADVNTKADDGLTPLMLASDFKYQVVREEPNPEVIRLLLAYGAKVNAQNSDGETPLYIAVHSLPLDKPISRSAKDILLQLITHGADPNLPTKNGDCINEYIHINNKLIFLLKK